MKLYFYNVIVVVYGLFINPINAVAQTIKLTGTISNSREVLPGVKIKVKESTQQVTTDADGRYQIDVEGNAVIHIIAKGHVSQIIPVAGKPIINVVLPIDSIYLKKILKKKLVEIEPYAHFLQIEKQAIIKITPAYHNARFAFLKAVYFEHPHVQDPYKPLAIFMTYCKTQKLLNENAEIFENAARTLGFELITDASPVNMDNMIAASSAYRNIAYTTTAGYIQKLDLFIPKTSSAELKPCILFFHDGGWAVHKRAWFEAQARYMAAKGYIAVNIDYRMLNAVTPLECVYDAKAAVRWVKANAEKYHIDTNKIGACGASAGAHLASILATTANDATLEGNGSNLGLSSKIQAAAGFATPTLTGRKTWPIGKDGKLPPWFEKISPYQHVGPGDAPMLFIHGKEDGLVAVDEVIDMYNLYLKNGLKAELDIKEGKGHVFYMDMAVVDRAYQFFEKVFN